MHAVVMSTVCAITAFAVGCGSSSRSGFGSETTTNQPAETDAGNGATSSGGFVTTGDSGAPSDDGCTAEARLVYVVTEENDLYSFTPNKLAFAKIGPLNCQAPSGVRPNSMAVDRSGTAWVNYSDGSLFEVSTKDASCKATDYKPQQGLTEFGMAFATNGPSSKEETLYVAGLNILFGKTFGKIDLTTMKLTLIGDYSGALKGKNAELTGTGDGRLFGFFATSPAATLAQIDTASGATSGDKSLQSVNTGKAWAFSFWGGDFWFYTATETAPSQVTQLRSSDGQITTVMPDVGGFHIVGAGVSTCAPTTAPK